MPGKKIVVEAKLEPAYINNSIDYTNSKFLLRIYDQLTNQTISDLDYDIKIFSDKELLLNLCIKSSAGLFNSKLIPINITEAIISKNGITIKFYRLYTIILNKMIDLK